MTIQLSVKDGNTNEEMSYGKVITINIIQTIMIFLNIIIYYL